LLLAISSFRCRFVVLAGHDFRERKGMGDYRLYCLNGVGKFTKAHDIAAKNDDEALALARQMKLPVKCELWERDRMVATLDAHKG